MRGSALSAKLMIRRIFAFLLLLTGLAALNAPVQASPAAGDAQVVASQSATSPSPTARAQGSAVAIASRLAADRAHYPGAVPSHALAPAYVLRVDRAHE